MKLSNWLPWNWGKHTVEVHREEHDRVHTLQSEINHVFDNFRRSFNGPLLAPTADGLTTAAMPRMEVGENDDEIEVSLELPGMALDDIDVSLRDNVLIVRGERKSHREDKHNDYHVREWSYGTVYRSVPLPPGLDLDRVAAAFKDGVLTVTLPKSEEARSQVKRISVNTA